MFSGPPLPLPPALPLRQLLAQAAFSGTLGAWIRGCRHTFSLCDAGASSSRVLVSADLGFLLGRCSHVAVREGMEAVVVEAERLIQWRTLQVVTATPFLPGLERLCTMFPGAHLDPDGFEVPISTGSPEEVLAECLTHGIPVSGTRIVYWVHCPPNLSRYASPIANSQ